MFSFVKRPREPGWLAVCPQDDCIEFAQVDRSAGGLPVLRGWWREPVAADATDPLSRFAQRERRNFRCTTLLRSGDYRFLQMDAPSVPDEELKEAVRWKIQELVDLPVEEAGFDVIPLPETGGSRQRQLFLVVAANSLIAPVVRRFQSADLVLEAIDLPEMAQRNVAALFEEEKRGLACLVFSPSSALLTFTYGGELFALRRIEIGSDHFANASPERREQLGERVVLELQRSMDTVDRQFSSISLSHMVVALPPDSGLEEQFRQALYLPFEPMQLAQRMDLSAFPQLLDPEAQRLALPVLGAALRDDDPEQAG